jgi:hypothetical protein
MGELAACRGSAEARNSNAASSRTLGSGKIRENPSFLLGKSWKIMENHGKSTISTGPWLQ